MERYKKLVKIRDNHQYNNSKNVYAISFTGLRCDLFGIESFPEYDDPWIPEKNFYINESNFIEMTEEEIREFKAANARRRKKNYLAKGKNRIYSKTETRQIGNKIIVKCRRLSMNNNGNTVADITMSRYKRRVAQVKRNNSSIMKIGDEIAQATMKARAAIAAKHKNYSINNVGMDYDISIIDQIRWNNRLDINNPDNSYESIRNDTVNRKIDHIDLDTNKDPRLIAKTRPIVEVTLGSLNKELQASALLDTGAEVSLISDRYLSYLNENNFQIRKSQVRMQSASQGSMDNFGCVKIPITIGKKKKWFNFIITNLDIDVFIGHDFMKYHGLIVDASSECAFWKSDPDDIIHYKDLKREFSKNQEVYAVKDFIIPKGSNDLLIPVELSSDCKLPDGNYDILISPLHDGRFCDKNNFEWKETILNKDSVDNLCIEVSNISTKDRLVKRGEKLGTLSCQDRGSWDSSRFDPNFDPLSIKLPEFNEIPKEFLDEKVPIMENLSAKDQENVARVLYEYRDVYNAEPGRTDLVRHHLDMKPGTLPKASHPYSYHGEKREFLQNIIKENVSNGRMVPCISPWGSPSVVVKKPLGGHRFVADYRGINADTIKDAYPIPRIDKTLESLRKGKIFTTLDMTSGYWQVLMCEGCIPKTAIISEDGTYAWKVMPQGMTNSGATFQRLMDFVLGGLKWSSCLAYIDDIVIFSEDPSLHYLDIIRVLERLRRAGLTVNPKKAHIAKRRIKFLGHIVSEDGITVDEDKIAAIKFLRVPENVKQLQTFLGIVGYYRKFVHLFGVIAQPLYQLLKKSSVWNWDLGCQEAFEEIKRRLCCAPILGYPDFSLPFIIDADASGYGIGATLLQEHLVDWEFDDLSSRFLIDFVKRKFSLNDEKIRKIMTLFESYNGTKITKFGNNDISFIIGNLGGDIMVKEFCTEAIASWTRIKGLKRTERVIAYLSRSLSEREQRWHIREQEALAIRWSLEKWRSYVEGMEIKVRTDHQSLRYIKTLKNPVGRLGRWALYFDMFNITVEYRKGALNGLNDVLSREPLPIIETNEEDHIDNVEIYSNCECNSVILDINEDGSVIHICAFTRAQKSKGEMDIDDDVSDKEAIEDAPLDIPRNPELYIDNTYGIAPANLAKAQKLDPFCINIMEKINNGQINDDNYGFEDKIFWRITNDILERSVRYKKLDRWVPVIPEVYREILLRLGHTNPLEGHRGGNATEMKLSARFFWPGMRKDVRDFIKSCTVCQQVKPNTEHRQGLFTGGEKFNQPFEVVAMDFMGPYTTSTGKKKFILVFQDRFSRWVEIIPTSSDKAVVIAKHFINEIVCRFGIPKAILSDNGPGFVSKVMGIACDVLGISRRFASPYHPQSNPVERVNREIKRQIRIFCTANRKWDELLQLHAASIRFSPNKMTGETPHRMLFARDPKLPLDMIFSELEILENTLTDKKLKDYRKTLNEEMEILYNGIKETVNKEMERAKNFYNKGRKDIHFEVGDLVWIKNRVKSSKEKDLTASLQKPRIGPFRIVEVKYNQVEIENIFNDSQKFRRNVSEIIPVLDWNGLDIPDQIESDEKEIGINLIHISNDNMNQKGGDVVGITDTDTLDKVYNSGWCWKLMDSEIVEDVDVFGVFNPLDGVKDLTRINLGVHHRVDYPAIAMTRQGKLVEL